MEGFWVFFLSIKTIITTVKAFLVAISKDPMTIVDRLCVRHSLLTESGGVALDTLG